MTFQSPNSKDLTGSDLERLINEVKRGNKKSFERLYREFSTSVYTYLIRSGVGANHRDDIMQEVFLSLQSRLSSYDPSYPFKPWLFKVVNSRISDYFRKNHKGAASPVSGSDSVRSHADSVELRETLRFVEKELSELSLLQRQAILLVCTESLTQEQAADSLGIPVNTFKTQLRRGRMKLAKAMAARSMAIEREVQQ